MQRSFKIVLSLILLLGISNAIHAYQQKRPVRYKDEVFENILLIQDLIYGKNKTQSGYTQRLKLDIYQPLIDTAKTRPLIILAHGGFFLFGSKENFAEECEILAKSGFVAVSINYRLIDVVESVVSYKRAVIDAVNDMKAAVRFFKKDAYTQNEFRIDTNNIFIGGYSAGAITSLHYAYVNTARDVYSIGKNLMLTYIIKHGGPQGNSGNPGYSSNIRGVINIAGSLQKADLVDANEPVLFSVHGTDDVIVPYYTGVSGNSNVKTEGSGLIHQRANEIGLKNKLISIKGADHFVFFQCDSCHLELRNFIYSNLK